MTNDTKPASDPRALFDSLGVVGYGQELEQGVGNYYVTDPIEARHFNLFTDRIRPGGRVLDAACGDGLEALTLVERGFTVDGYDLSPRLVRRARERLTAASVADQAHLWAGDMTRPLPSVRFPRGAYDGVMLAQVIQFLNDDAAVAAVIRDHVTALRDGGALYLSHTYYDAPVHIREWVLDGQVHGTSAYHARPLPLIRSMVEAAGLIVFHSEHFDARTTGVGQYMNDYVLAYKPPHPALYEVRAYL